MNGFIDLEFYKKEIENMSDEELLKRGAIAHCREMDKADIYEWIGNDEVQLYKYKKVIDKIKEYVKENKKRLYQGRNEFTCEIQYSDEVVKVKDIEELLEEIND